MDRHNGLMRCHARIAQAPTLEEAIRGHSDMLNLLEVKLSCIRRSPVRDDDKALMIDDIIGRMRHHRDAIDRLTDIIEYDHAFIWWPQ